jgi:hypothetical protein
VGTAGGRGGVAVGMTPVRVNDPPRPTACAYAGAGLSAGLDPFE